MGYKYLVKSFVWLNGRVQSTNVEFSDEAQAISYAKSITLAETVKVYVDDQLMFAENKQIQASSYA
jgi:hypothetical protein